MSVNQPTPDLQRLWGVVNRAVRDPELRARPGGVVQNIWESYKQSYLAVGAAPPPLSIQQVNRLVATASATVRAEYNLAGAINTYRRFGVDQAISAEHLARDIDYRGALTPFYRVRYQLNVTVDGEPHSAFATWSPELNLPATTAGLLDALHEAALAAVENDSPLFGAEFADLGDYVSITEV